MTKEEFSSRLKRATDLSLRLSESVLGFPLPVEVRFDFGDLSRYQTQKPVPAGKVKILGGRILEPDQIVNLTSETLAKYLWIDGKIPIWINLRADRSDGNAYFIEVVVSGDLTEEEGRFYHKHEGNPPFHVLGPAVADFGRFVKRA